MKRTKFLSLLLVAALTVTSLVTAPDVSAKKAKKPKLSCKKKINMTVGQTKKIKVKNGKKKAKVTWKTSKKKIVKLSKQVKKGNKASVKLKARKKGKSTITATYKLGKKKTKLTCKVTVKKKPVPAPTSVVVPPTGNPTPTPGNVTPTPTANGPTPTVYGPTPTATSTADVTPTPTAGKPTADPYPEPKDVDLSKFGSLYNAETGEVVFDNVTDAKFVDLPQSIKVGETVEVTIEGTYTGNTGFRMWVGNGNDSFDTKYKVFDGGFVDGKFASTFALTNECGQNQAQGTGGKEAATKLTFKGKGWQAPDNVVDGLKISSISIKYGSPASYLIDGEKTTAKYNANVLETSIAQYEGIIFKNPAKNPAEYGKVAVTYTSDNDTDAYVFDKNMTDGTGANAAGQHKKGTLDKTEADKTLTFSVDEVGIFGFKAVNMGAAAANVKIKSIVFSGAVAEETAIPIEGEVVTIAPYGEVLKYAVPADAAKLQASFVKNGTTYTETAGIEMLESEINAYDNIWSAVKKLSDKAPSTTPTEKWYDDNRVKVSVLKTSATEAEITVQEDGKADRKINVAFTAADTEIVAQVEDTSVAERKFSVKVTSSEPNKAEVTKNNGGNYTVVAGKSADGYSVTVNTAGGNYIKIEKADQNRTLFVSKNIVEKYEFKLAYFKGTVGPGPDKTPGPGETSDPDKTPEPGETADPDKTPGPDDTPGPDETQEPTDTPKPTLRPSYAKPAQVNDKGSFMEYAMPATASSIELVYTKEEDSKVILDLDQITTYIETYSNIYDALDMVNSKDANWEGIKYFSDDEADYISCKKISANEAEIKVVNQSVESNYKLSFIQSEISPVLAGDNDADTIYARVESVETGAVYNVSVSSADKNCVEILKDGTKEGYMVSLETDGFYFTITATTPSGNELVIKKAADEILFTASKPFAEALGLQVGYMGSDTPKPTPAPTPTPFVANATIDVPAECMSMSIEDQAIISVSVDVGTVENVVWSVDGDAVTVEKDATDKSKAVITAVKAGKATVKAVVTAKDGGQTDECEATAEVNVKYEPAATIAGAPVKMESGSTKELTASVDSGLIDKNTVVWSVEGDAVTKTDNATDKSKVTIQAVKAGKATVTVTFDANDDTQTAENVTASVEIEVLPQTAMLVDISTSDKYDSVNGDIDITPVTEIANVDLPNPVKFGEKIRITVEGTYEGNSGFRMMIGNGSNSYCTNPKIFEANFASGEFRETFDLSNDNTNGSDNPNKLDATKISFKGIAWGQNVSGLRVKSITVDYVDNTPDIEVDLTKESSYKHDNGATSQYYVDVLNANLGQYQGIVFANSGDAPANYKYVTVTYSTDSEGVHAYVFDGKMENDGLGSAPEIGQVDKGIISAGKEVTVTYDASKSANGFKLVNLSATTATVSIKSIVFSYRRPVSEVPAQDIDVELCAETAHNADPRPWWYEDPTKNQYLADGSVKAAIGDGRGIAFYFNKDKTPIRVTEYSKIVVTLATDVENEPIGLSASLDAEQLDYDKKVTEKRFENQPANTDLTLELDLSSIVDPESVAYGIVIADRWAQGANFTIKSVKVVAKK